MNGCYARRYPGGWDDEREAGFQLWYGDMRSRKPELPEQPDLEGKGLDMRRGYLELQLGLQPQEPR